MSLHVRADEPSIANELKAARPSSKAPPKRWVAFSGVEGEQPSTPVQSAAPTEAYRLEACYLVEGQREAELCHPPREMGVSLGGQMWRREFVANGRPMGMPGPWIGSIDGARSSTDAEVETLHHVWRGNPFRVALLLACAHDSRFFALKPHEHNFDHLGTPAGSLSLDAPLSRVVRHLHRTGNTAPGGWDTFAYFEMLPADVAHVRAHLADWRALSPGRRLVEREIELWMVKHLGAGQT